MLEYTAANQITLFHTSINFRHTASKYNENTTFDDLRAENQSFKVTNLKNLEKVDKLSIADNHRDVAHIVLAFYLTRPSLDVVLLGAKRAVQVVDNLTTTVK